MRSFFHCGLALATLLTIVTAVPAAADPSVPSTDAASAAKAPTADTKSATNNLDVATLLFGTPMWDKVPAGAKLNYTFEKVTSEASFGTPFKDQVTLTLQAGENANSRVVDMALFNGSNRKPAGPFPSDQQNPILLVIMENNVQELSHVFKANPRYLKTAIRKAWRENPKIEQAKVEIGGKDVAVTRITVTPFVGDKEADNMRGLSDLTYTVDVSNEVPGYIAVIDIRAPAQGKPLFAETLQYASETNP